MNFKDMLAKGYESRGSYMWPTITGENLDRSAYVTASEIGSCAREIKFKKQFDTPGPDVTTYKAVGNWGIFERGHTVEDWFFRHLRAGWDKRLGTLILTGEEQKSFVDANQSSTPDGVVLHKDRVAILETKSFDSRSNPNKFPKDQHVDQVIQNLDLVSDYYGKSPSSGYLIYIDASNYLNLHVFEIPFDEEHADRLMERAKFIMETPIEDIPAEGMFNEGCKYCAFTAQCSQMIREKRGTKENERFSNAATGFFGQSQGGNG